MRFREQNCMSKVPVVMSRANRGAMIDDIDHYLQQLREEDSENAFFNLLEIDDSLVPKLIEAYWHESSRDFRLVMLNAIWEHRLPTTLGFLGEALKDNDSEIWKEALDGIVAINALEGLEILEAEKRRLLPFRPKSNDRLEWVEEALAQLSENLVNR